MTRLHPDDIRAIARAIVAELAATYALGGATAQVDAVGSMAPKELAHALMVSLVTLREWRATGYGPPWFTLGARVRYPRAGVTAWMRTIASSNERRARVSASAGKRGRRG